MSSTVWAVPAKSIRESYILRFLKDARCSVRVVEARLFKTSRLVDQTPEDRRPLGTLRSENQNENPGLHSKPGSNLAFARFRLK